MFDVIHDVYSVSPHPLTFIIKSSHKDRLNRFCEFMLNACDVRESQNCDSSDRLVRMCREAYANWLGKFCFMI
jgi:hypothetical protein